VPAVAALYGPVLEAKESVKSGLELRYPPQVQSAKRKVRLAMLPTQTSSEPVLFSPTVMPSPTMTRGCVPSQNPGPPSWTMGRMATGVLASQPASAADATSAADAASATTAVIATDAENATSAASAAPATRLFARLSVGRAPGAASARAP
jgi:hypothetical protein